MLPVARKRNPNSSDSSNLITSEMSSRSSQSAFRRLRRIPLKAKCFVCLFLLLTVYIYGMAYWAWGKNRLTKEEFLEIDKCPSCYGSSMCFAFLDDQYSLSGLSKYEMFDVMNLKNVHFAYHKYHGHNVVIKKLAHTAEIKMVDDKICEDSIRKPGCDLGRTTVLTKTAQDIARNGLQPKHFKDTTFMFTCPTYKLLEKIMGSYKEKPRKDWQISMDDKLQILYTAKVNPEPLLLQTFPRSQGWPFPEYYGACGRYVVVEHGGKELGEFYNAPFKKRADLAYQMLKIAKRLTDDPEWALYWTDLAYDNFGVDLAGKLTLIDVENIIVVDRKAVKIANKDHWNDFDQTPFEDCRDDNGKIENCFTFDTQQLCTHHTSDLNYYAACRNMLWKHADEDYSGRPGGLLHDTPADIERKWDLENLLFECVKPSTKQGRLNSAMELMDALRVISGQDLQETRKKDVVVDKPAVNKADRANILNRMA